MELRDEAIPERRAIMRKLRATPDCDGFRTALKALVELSDTEIIPDLEEMIRSQDLDSGHSATGLRADLTKLRHQDSPVELLRIVQQERENGYLLMWSVRRLLWMRTPKKTIYATLGQNRRKNLQGRDVALEVERTLRTHELEAIARRVGESSCSALDTIEGPDTWRLNAQEFRTYRRELDKCCETSDIPERIRAYTALTRPLYLSSLLGRAPAGE